MPVELPVFDIEQVSKHNKPEDGWIVVRDGVYNVSKFIDFHPGGKSILTQNLGTDVTEAFMEPSIHTHSEKAWRMLERYKIGTISTAKEYPESSIDSKIKHLADVNKALVMQVYNMDPSLYHTWLHSFPPLVSIRLFESSYLEFFSRYPWWYILPLWIPVILYYFIQACLVETATPSKILLATLGGLFFWTALEYFIHRFLFHTDTSSHIGSFYHFIAHGIHHLSPMDPDRLVFPPIFSIFLVAFVYKLTTFLPFAYYGAFFAGGLGGFISYDSMHYIFHHGTICDQVPYLKSMRSRHFRHHYMCPNKNFGVSSPLWDFVCGTSE